MQRSGAILAFVLLFGALAALLVFAGSWEIRHPTAAEAFFEKYQQRVPLTYDSGRIDTAIDRQSGRTVIRTDFALKDGRPGSVSNISGTGPQPAQASPAESSAYGGFVGAEAKIGPGIVSTDLWSRKPTSVRFRDDPRAEALGAHQLLVEFASQRKDLTALTQLLMIDADTYKLIFGESGWGLWDPVERQWIYQTSRLLSQIDQPLTLPMSAH